MLVITFVFLFVRCQGGQEMPWDKAQTNVDGTKWLASAVEDDTIYELYFMNGQYLLKYYYKYNNGWLTIKGSYAQDGTKITFEKKNMVTWGFFFVEEGEISLNKMRVPLYNDNYWSDKEYHSTLDFMMVIE